MKLTKLAIIALRGLDQRIKERIVAASGKTLSTVNRWIANNDSNLTKAAVLQIIREETGLSDAQILEEEKAVA